MMVLEDVSHRRVRLDADGYISLRRVYVEAVANLKDAWVDGVPEPSAPQDRRSQFGHADPPSRGSRDSDRLPFQPIQLPVVEPDRDAIDTLGCPCASLLHLDAAPGVTINCEDENQDGWSVSH